MDEDDRTERKNLFANLKRINLKIEIIEKQKSRAKWLQVGDLNT